jgi:hypothetical protein
MKNIKDRKRLKELQTWEEKSGLLDFLSSISREIDKYNEGFGFGINSMVNLPSDIDGDTDLPLKVGFVLVRDNPLMPELSYCLYSLLKERLLYGYIGLYREGSMKTIKELKPVKDFRKGKPVLYDWLNQLVRASCEKIML